MKKIILIFFLLFVFTATAFAVISEPDLKSPAPPNFAKARVLEVTEAVGNSDLGSAVQQVTFKVLSGSFRGREVTVDHMVTSMMGGKMELKPRDKIIVYVDENPSLAESPNGEPLFNIADYTRDSVLFWLLALYVVLILVLGGMQGLKALGSLLLTILLLFFVLFPLTLWGFSPILVSIVISGVASFVVFRMVAGKGIKSTSAALGTFVGVAIAGILATVVGKMIHVTGMSSEESRILLYSMDLKINYQGLLFSGILIGALGAIMDVGMSIASAIEQVKKAHPNHDFSSLFQAGMSVGRDVMGTMSNTLILAYTGSALPLLLLMMANKVSFLKIINLEMIATEIVRALAGSIGLVLCFPVTAFVSALLYFRECRR